MLKKSLISCVCLCLAAGTLQAQSENGQLADAARKLLQDREKGVISLALVLKIEAKGGGGSEQERKAQSAAAIIDPSGLAVTSLSMVKPKLRGMGHARQQNDAD